MPLSDRVLEANSLRIGDSGAQLDIGLPWFRSIPRSAVEQLVLEIDGSEVELKTLNGVPSDEFLDPEAEWFPQDRVLLGFSQELEAGTDHQVSLTIKIAIPNLVMPDGKPVVIPTTVVKNLTAR